MMTQKVMVVGGTGYLGSRVVRSLLARRGPSGIGLCALSRSDRSDEVLRQLDRSIEPVRGDLMDVDSLARALQGIDVVVTTAAGYTAHSKGDTANTDVVRLGAIKLIAWN